MSDRQEYYKRTYGMSFYTYLKLCKPTRETWYIDGMKHLEDTPWFKDTEAKEIVGEEAVRELVNELHLS